MIAYRDWSGQKNGRVRNDVREWAVKCTVMGFWEGKCIHNVDSGGVIGM